eukprot:12877947-Alexandrium_andersonii.AAC.1
MDSMGVRKFDGAMHRLRALLKHTAACFGRCMNTCAAQRALVYRLWSVSYTHLTLPTICSV